MARAEHAAIRFRRELHWPRRQQFDRPAPLASVRADEAAAPGVTLVIALMIAGVALVSAAIGAECAIALVRWSIPL